MSEPEKRGSSRVAASGRVRLKTKERLEPLERGDREGG